MEPGGIGLPIGAIVITSGATPVGWVEWGGSEDRLILGSESSATATGGTNGSWSISTNAGSSNHSGVSGSYKHYYRSGGGSWTRTQSASNKDSHTHTISASLTLAKNRRRFIKSTEPGVSVPKGADVFSDTNVLSDYDGDSVANVGDNYFLTINAGSIGTTERSGTVSSSTNSAGSAHNHYGTTDGSTNSGSDSTLRPETIGIGDIRPSGGGGHKHSCSGSLSDNMKRAILRSWTRVEESTVIADRTIVMFEGETPEGWQTCNGANGTIDLRDYFICLSTSNVGLRTGDNKVSASSISIGTTGSHKHGLNSGTTLQIGTSYGHQQSVSHSHSASGFNTTWKPPFRSIKFIQRIES